MERPEETDDVLRLGLHRLTITEFPQVRALASALASYDGAAELDRGLDVLFIGLGATVSPPSPGGHRRFRRRSSPDPERAGTPRRRHRVPR